MVDRKGSLSAFRPKKSGSKVAETFRPKMTFRPKWYFRQKWDISAEIPSFGRISAWFRHILFTERMIFLPKLPYFGRNMLLSASFGPFGYFRFVSAFGRNSSFQNALFRFRPKLFRSISTGFRVSLTATDIVGVKPKIAVLRTRLVPETLFLGHQLLHRKKPVTL